MACDAQEIATAAKCLMYLSPHQSLAAWAVALCAGVTPPPTSDTRITEEGATRITEEGDTRIIE